MDNVISKLLCTLYLMSVIWLIGAELITIGDGIISISLILVLSEIAEINGKMK